MSCVTPKGQAALPARIKQRLNHKRGSLHEITFDERSRNPQDAKAPLRELPITSRVVSALPLVARIPIDFDDERGLAREKVDDVVADDDLPTKLDTEQSASAHQAPHERLGVSGRMPHAPSALLEERFASGTLS